MQYAPSAWGRVYTAPSTAVSTVVSLNLTFVGIPGRSHRNRPQPKRGGRGAFPAQLPSTETGALDIFLPNGEGQEAGEAGEAEM